MSDRLSADAGRPVVPDLDRLLAVFESAALAAGRQIMAIAQDGIAAETKADQSVVTRADREAEAIILAALQAHFPGIAVVAEEAMAAGPAPEIADEPFFLVDPLDGTREFVNGGDDFTVNIALVRNGEPVAGVVYAPARRMLYAGLPGRAERIMVDAGHEPAQRACIGVCRAGGPTRIVASKSHLNAETEAFIRQHQPQELVSVGSSLKFCLVAAGEADLYPRFGRTMQWDTAAGDAVLRAAGGMTRTVEGAPLRYGMRVTPNDTAFANAFFIAASR